MRQDDRSDRTPNTPPAQSLPNRDLKVQYAEALRARREQDHDESFLRAARAHGDVGRVAGQLSVERHDRESERTTGERPYDRRDRRSVARQEVRAARKGRAT